MKGVFRLSFQQRNALTLVYTWFEIWGLIKAS
jgi:hypothetical protein